MRIAVVSDIHGNYQALESVLADIDSQQVDHMISLGDNIGYGPEPDRVVDELISRAVPSVLGNHELALFDHSYYKKLNFSTRDSLDITKRLLSPTHRDWLGNLANSMVMHGARFVHGCPPSSAKTYLLNPPQKALAAIFNNFSEHICFAGHTHALTLFTMDKNGQTYKTRLGLDSIDYCGENRYIFIPGSVGQPRDDISDKAKYGIWDQQQQRVEIREISYDVETTITLLHKFKFPASNGLRLKWHIQSKQ